LKLIYKIMLFFIMFQMIVLMVNAMGVFPQESRLYSDLETDDFQEKSPEEALTYIFVPSGRIGPFQVNSFHVMAILTIVVLGSAGLGIVTHTGPIIPSIAMIGLVVWPMVNTSRGFINTIVYNWDVNSMMYLGLALGVGIVAIVVITIIEQPAHGRSG